MAPQEVVVMELPAEHAGASAAIDSCRLVLGVGHCRSAAEAGAAATWYVTIAWTDPDDLTAHVELHRGNARGPLHAVRNVEFSPEDPLDQRYRAIGLLVVSQVVAGARDPAPQPIPMLSPVPPQLRPPAVHWGADAMFRLGPGLTGLPWKTGGGLGLWLRPVSLPVGAYAQGLASASSARPDALWFEGVLGMTLHLESSNFPLWAELSTGALIQRIELEAKNPSLGREQEQLVRLGGRSNVTLFAPVTNAISVFLGGDASLLRRRYEVEVESVPRGGEGYWTWGIVAGVRAAR